MNQKNSSRAKRNRLVLELKRFDTLLVAFSSGVDSTFMLAVAHEVLAKGVVAVTAESPVHPTREKESAIAIAGNLGVRHIVVPSKEMSLPNFVANQKDRCYICKKSLFEDLLSIAAKMGIEHIAHGANVDDLEDFRPGFKAAREMGIVAPMIKAGLTKNDIRLLSKEMFLETWNEPSTACLATRIPYGTPITRKALEMVEQAEDVMITLGFMACRVRHHDTVARIEIVPRDFKKIFDEKIKTTIIRKFRKIGFSHVTVDMEGYVQGKMNRLL